MTVRLPALVIAISLIYCAPAFSQRSLSAEDVVRFATIGDTSTLRGPAIQLREPVYSPDGNLAATIITKGVLAQNGNEGRLIVVRRNAAAYEYKSIANFISFGNARPIAGVKWLNNRELIFAAAEGSKPMQVYRADIYGRLEQLSSETTDVLHFEITPNGRHLFVYAALPPATPPESTEACRRDGCEVTASRFTDALTGNSTLFGQGGSIATYDLGSGRRNALRRPLATTSPIERCAAVFPGGVSPQGRYVVQTCVLRNVPLAWHEYDLDGLTDQLRRGNSQLAVQNFLIDLQTSSVRPLTGTPAYGDQLVWIDNGRALIVVGGRQPLNNASGDDRKRWAKLRGVLLIEPASGRIRRLGDLAANARIADIDWAGERDQLVVHLDDGSGLSLLQWKRDGDSWIESRVQPLPVVANSNLHHWLFVEQSLNERPVLRIKDRSGQKPVIVDPNAWLDDVRLGRVEWLGWKLPDGGTGCAQLTFPTSYRPGRRYPLVIQTHGADRDRFSLVGESTNFASQLFASQGMFVAQIDESCGVQARARRLEKDLSAVMGTRDELIAATQVYESAIDHLELKGLINTKAVAIIGWSRTGNYVGYALAHSKRSFAAAILGEANDYGWWTYVNWGVHREIETMYGAEPFGDGLKKWIEAAPSFRLNQIETPVFLWNGGGNLDGLWDWFAILRRLNKPVEYWYLPTAEHELFLPSHRIGLYSRSVNWLNNYLNQQLRR